MVDQHQSRVLNAVPHVENLSERVGLALPMPTYPTGIHIQNNNFRFSQCDRIALAMGY